MKANRCSEKGCNMFVIHLGNKDVCRTHWHEKRQEEVYQRGVKRGEEIRRDDG